MSFPFKISPPPPSRSKCFEKQLSSSLQALTITHTIMPTRRSCVFWGKLSVRALCGTNPEKTKQIAYRFLYVPRLSVPQPYLCNGIFIRKEYSRNNVALGNWRHKAFSYFLLFVYWPDKWWRIFRPVLEVGGWGACWKQPSLRGKLRDSVLAGPPYDSFIRHTFLLSVPLSARGMFMNVSLRMIWKQ